MEPEEFARLLRGWISHAGPGTGVSADFAVGAGSPPRLGLDGKPELTEAPRLRATAAEGIPEGFRQARPGRVAPGGAEARSPSPARNESGRDRNSPEILKSQINKRVDVSMRSWLSAKAGGGRLCSGTTGCRSGDGGRTVQNTGESAVLPNRSIEREDS